MPFQPVNTIVISEDMAEGQSVKAFKVYVHLPHYKNKRILVFNGNTIGHKIICKFSAVCTPKITVEITDHDGYYKIKDIKAYFVR